MQKYAVGVDLGGTKVEACLLDEDRNLHGRFRIPSEPEKGPEQVAANILQMISEASGEKEYAAVGMGTPGTYIPEEDRIFGAPHSPTYEKPGLISLLAKKLPVPLIVENDANCLAIAEYYAACKGKYSHVMAVIMGTGFGSGLILNEKLYRGATGAGGEIGHTSIAINGRRCECGRKDCVEAYLSGPSHSRRYEELSGEKLPVQKIVERYESAEPAAVDLFEESCQILAEVFANAVNFLDLEAIILGGGVSNIPIWYERVPALMEEKLFGPPRREVPLIKAKLGDSAGVVGAGYLALRQLGLMDF